MEEGRKRWREGRKREKKNKQQKRRKNVGKNKITCEGKISV